MDGVNEVRKLFGQCLPVGVQPYLLFRNEREHRLLDLHCEYLRGVVPEDVDSLHHADNLPDFSYMKDLSNSLGLLGSLKLREHILGKRGLDVVTVGGSGLSLPNLSEGQGNPRVASLLWQALQNLVHLLDRERQKNLSHGIPQCPWYI